MTTVAPSGADGSVAPLTKVTMGAPEGPLGPLLLQALTRMDKTAHPKSGRTDIGGDSRRRTKSSARTCDAADCTPIGALVAWFGHGTNLPGGVRQGTYQHASPRAQVGR